MRIGICPIFTLMGYGEGVWSIMYDKDLCQAGSLQKALCVELLNL